MKLNMKVDDQTFVVEVGDLSSRPVRVLVDGEAFEVWPEEGAQAGAPVTPQNGSHPVVSVSSGAVSPRYIPQPVIPQASAATAAAGAGKVVLAPIPGVIITVSVKAGDVVAFGQELCVLEAMKMKNIIRANRSGTVSEVRVAAGDSVKHSQVLLEFSD